MDVARNSVTDNGMALHTHVQLKFVVLSGPGWNPYGIRSELCLSSSKNGTHTKFYIHFQKVPLINLY